MMFTGKRRTVILLFAGLLILSGAVLGTALGLSIAVNHNTRNMDELMASRPAIPSRLLDINGELITEFFSDEKRDIVPITSLPENQIYALLTREDAPFFEHKGVAVGGLFRAFIRSFQHLITGKGSLQGASTLTMQLAGSRHADRSVVKVSRKLKEIWWSFQLERRFTKQEILEQYLNTVYFGHNTYGVEAASQFFFGHSAVDNSPAESVMLVIQLAGSGLYSPFIHPNAARERQKEILNQMVDARHISTDLADSSFDNYWAGFDWSRSSSDSPYFDRLANDQAPYFTEYIRSQIDQYLFGQQDIYRDGYTIYTTLNLSYQKEAEKAVQAGLREWNEMFQNDRSGKTGYAASNLTPMIDLLSLSFGIPEIRVAGAQRRKLAQEFMDSEFTPVMDMMAMTFGLGDLKSAANISYNRARAFAKKNNVETALVTLDNRTGYILAMIGGSEFNRNNQFNRAMDAKVMPGSAFKPLYYAEAISSGQFTPATLIYDGPEVFISPDGTPYIPGNYDGKYHGNVLLRTALSKSYNIPALKILKAVGFDAAINRAAALLGITDPQEIGSTFDRVYPLGLGTLSVTPVQMARAYATMANRGQAVEPLAIRYIEDRDGNVIVNPEREMREEQERKNTQILSPQAAYIMSSLLQSTIRSGTLYYARRYVEGFDGMPMAGKTGTTQNWTNAWTMGFSPYYTTALWVGFDKQGNSLGTGMTGARTGRAWSAYMKNIHKDLPRIDFPRPETGIAERNIDIRTGMLPEEGTPEDFIRREVFIAGTQPTARSTIARFENERNDELSIKIAVDSTLNIPETDAASETAYLRDLFAEQGLDNLYLGGGGIGTTGSPLDKPSGGNNSGGKKPAPSVLD